MPARPGSGPLAGITNSYRPRWKSHSIASQAEYGGSIPLIRSRRTVASATVESPVTERRQGVDRSLGVQLDARQIAVTHKPDVAEAVEHGAEGRRCEIGVEVSGTTADLGLADPRADRHDGVDTYGPPVFVEVAVDHRHLEDPREDGKPLAVGVPEISRQLIDLRLRRRLGVELLPSTRPDRLTEVLEQPDEHVFLAVVVVVEGGGRTVRWATMSATVVLRNPRSANTSLAAVRNARPIGDPCSSRAARRPWVDAGGGARSVTVLGRPSSTAGPCHLRVTGAVPDPTRAVRGVGASRPASKRSPARCARERSRMVGGTSQCDFGGIEVVVPCLHLLVHESHAGVRG